jgi:hypothetical protein
MLSINIALTCVLTLAIGGACYWGYRNFKRHQFNIAFTAQLEDILLTTQKVVKKNREMVRQQKQKSVETLYDPSTPVSDLGSPAVLSTLITVLVKKFGDIRLTLNDFVIPNEQYVSVYVDTSTNDLILSINHSLEGDDPYPTFTLRDVDDNTFH